MEPHTKLRTVKVIRPADAGVIPFPIGSPLVFMSEITNGISGQAMYQVRCADGQIRLVYPHEVRVENDD